MRLSLENDPNIYRIKSYTETEITIQNPQQSLPADFQQLSEDEQMACIYTRAQRSFLMYPHALQLDWPPADLESLQARHMAGVLNETSELILLGTGMTLRFPAAEICADIHRAGIGLEIMDSHSACRTYNILAAEGRQVALAVILP